jgi:transposase
MKCTTPSLTDEQRKELTRLASRPRRNRSVSFRARVILCSANGLTAAKVADQLKCNYQTVYYWRRRFQAGGVDALYDDPRPGTGRKISDDQIEKIITQTLETIPKNATHWSTRSMAKNIGLSQSAISRVWRAFGLRPHRASTFSLSQDPLFVEKVRDVVGLYMSPPSNAIVLSVDEKSQIQALNRTQPVLPMMPSTPERYTPDYLRHGTTTLFAALDVKTGKVIGQCHQRHRSLEFRKFLNYIDDNTDPNLELHLILDNYGTHKSPMIHRWLVRHPRFHLHFIPTHSSWLNLVERWFGLLTERQIKRGSHTSVNQLKSAITSYIDSTNSDPKPFVWTKSADVILEKVAKLSKRILNTQKAFEEN